MQPRYDAFKAAPGALAAMSGLQDYVNKSGLEKSLLELVKTRASQINGCAFCLHMHTRDARAQGESEERLYLLDAWRDSSLYTDRERAALAWTEALTNLSDGHVSDAAYDKVRAHFGEKELVDLSWAIAAINAWNRVVIASRTEAGKYTPGQHG